MHSNDKCFPHQVTFRKKFVQYLVVPNDAASILDPSFNPSIVKHLIVAGKNNMIPKYSHINT